MTAKQYRLWCRQQQSHYSRKGHPERNIQIACVNWFRATFPEYLCFSVPNGGSRNAIEAHNLKLEGALAGVSDLICVALNKVIFIELKCERGRQTPKQRQFEAAISRLGFTYALCHSLAEFINIIQDWLKMDDREKTLFEEAALRALNGLCANPDYNGDNEDTANDAVEIAHLFVDKLNEAERN